ncbi:MAG: cell division protein ZapA [Sphingomonadales bacterium]|nr:cell division protein ZapA [Sphingomonadales bacterium]
MEHIHLNIRIGDRTYPVKVDPSAAPRLQSAEELVRQRMDEYKSTYPSSDKTDQLAMTALHFAHAGLSTHSQNMSQKPTPAAELSALSESVDRILGLLDRRNKTATESESP